MKGLPERVTLLGVLMFSLLILTWIFILAVGRSLFREL